MIDTGPVGFAICWIKFRVGVNIDNDNTVLGSYTFYTVDLNVTRSSHCVVVA